MNALQGTLTTAIVPAILDGIMAILALGMMFAYSPMLTGIVLASTASLSRSDLSASECRSPSLRC